MTAPKRSSALKKIIFVSLALLAAGFGYYFWANERGATAPTFVTASVTRGDLRQTVTATGQLDSLVSVDVGSQISGLILKLHVDFNSVVKKGDLLAEIDPSTYQQRLRQAESELASTQAQFRLQELSAGRVRELRSQGLVSSQDLDQAEAQLAQARAQVSLRQAAVDGVRIDLGRCRILSPIDGIVISKQTEEGKTVAASLNAPVLFTIANNLAKMQITAAVSEADIGAVAVGQKATFTVDAFPNRSFSGEISQIRNAPKTVDNVVSYDAIINVSNPDLRLRPGMTANATIIVAQSQQALRVPNAALRVRMPESLRAEADSGAGNMQRPTSAEGDGDGSRKRGRGRRDPFGLNELSEEQQQKVKAIMAEVGFTPGSGPPSDEQKSEILRLMSERGLPLPASKGDSTVVVRTLYRLPSATKPPEPVQVKIGITDGSFSEVISGLQEGDVVVTAAVLPSDGVAAPNNPFNMRRR